MVFVSSDFIVPNVLETENFRLRMLTVNDLVKDYDAVMSSVEHLQGVFGPHHHWPSYDLTIEQDLIDLGWHQKEFQKNSSFAYTVMNIQETQCLGCVYIYPSDKKNYDAEIYLWVRKTAYEKGLDKILYASVQAWMKDKWPFKKPAFPGRSIDWNAWEALA